MGCSLPTSTGEFTGFLNHQQYVKTFAESTADPVSTAPGMLRGNVHQEVRLRAQSWAPTMSIWNSTSRVNGTPERKNRTVETCSLSFVCWLLFSQLSVSLLLLWFFLFISFVLNGHLFWNDAILNWHCETVWDESQFLRGHGKDTWSVAAW